jgi:hypothetical protein
MSEWAGKQVREVLDGGLTVPGDNFFRMKVTGRLESKWFNLTPAQMQAIATVLTQPGDLPPCEHPLTSFQVIEEGYVRTWDTRIDEDEKVIHAFFSGTEDWSDEGTGEFLVCTECAQMRPIPPDYEIDWQ